MILFIFSHLFYIYYCVFARYHHYPDLKAYLQDLASSYPDLARLYSAGTSVQGRELYVLEISDNPGVHEPGESLVYPLPSLQVLGERRTTVLISPSYALKQISSSKF